MSLVFRYVVPIVFSPRVAMIQYRLGMASSGVDGKFGPNTENAVAAFQSREGLPVNGEVDERTGRALGLPFWSAETMRRLDEPFRDQQLAKGTSGLRGADPARWQLEPEYPDKFESDHDFHFSSQFIAASSWPMPCRRDAMNTVSALIQGALQFAVCFVWAMVQRRRMPDPPRCCARRTTGFTEPKTIGIRQSRWTTYTQGTA
ncbi:MAG: peptidoglycan-binding domain-containing protein [Verrucomicrobiales bacterium]